MKDRYPIFKFMGSWQENLERSAYYEDNSEHFELRKARWKTLHDLSNVLCDSGPRISTEEACIARLKSYLSSKIREAIVNEPVKGTKEFVELDTMKTVLQFICDYMNGNCDYYLKEEEMPMPEELEAMPMPMPEEAVPVAVGDLT